MTQDRPPRFTHAQFGEILRREDAQKLAWHEELRRLTAEAAAPISPDLRAHLVQLFSGDMYNVMRSHQGHELAERRNSYIASLSIMRRSLRVLLNTIASFEIEALADRSELFGPQGQGRLQQIMLDVQKEIFTCANAAVSLVDHARRVTKDLSIPAYQDMLLESFGEDGLHEFVTTLRVLLHHLNSLNTTWNISYDLVKGAKTASFCVFTDALIYNINKSSKSFSKRQREGAMRYISGGKSLIDLSIVFCDYEIRVNRFNNWLTTELQAESIVALRDYDSIIREKELTNKRAMYHAFLGNWLRWEKPPNPHSHLALYLTPDQVMAVSQLPLNSREQVDLVITYGDQEGVVDDRLREQIYELFRRSGEPQS